MTKQTALTLISIALISAFLWIHAQETPPQNQDTNTIKIDREKREISITGTFNLTSGILEFVAASTKTPRDYESLFLLNAKPSQIKAALKEIGLEPKQDPAQCAHLEFFVTWNINQTSMIRSMTEFLDPNQKNKDMSQLMWLYDGSPTQEGTTIPEDTNGEIIALQPNIPGIIHPNIDFGNPYEETKQEGFRANEKTFKNLIQSKLLPKKEDIKKKELLFIIKLKESRE